MTTEYHEPAKHSHEFTRDELNDKFEGQAILMVIREIMKSENRDLLTDEELTKIIDAHFDNEYEYALLLQNGGQPDEKQHDKIEVVSPEWVPRTVSRKAS
jgi:hypothetical protein